jgi:DNA-binding MarR family transcriptional regulator
MECINALKNPTIAEFAHMMNISAPNAAYRVNSLLQKGYIEKIQSKEDQREYHIRPTKKYINYSNIYESYLKTIDERCKERFSKEDYDKLQEMLNIIDTELMPELNLEHIKKSSKKSK